MSTTVHVFGEDRHVEIECNDDEPTVWIRQRSTGMAISLSLTPEQREQLRQALNAADRLEALPGVPA